MADEKQITNSNATKPAESTLRDFYYVVFRHKWSMLWVFIGVSLAVTVYTFIIPEYYQSQAKLIVRLGRESVALDPTATTGQIVPVAQTRMSEINSNLEILRSRDMIERVVDKVGVNEILIRPDEKELGDQSFFGRIRDFLRRTRRKVRAVGSTPEILLEQLDLKDKLRLRDLAVVNVMSNLVISNPEMSSLIEIKYESRSADLSRKVLSTLISEYFIKHSEVYHNAGSYEFFNQQTDTLSRRIQEIEEKLRNLKNSTGIAAVDEQRSIVLRRIGDLKTEIDEKSSMAAASQAKVKALESMLANVPEFVELNTVTGDPMVTQHLFSLKLREQELLSKYTEENRLVVEVRNQLLEAEKALESMVRVTKGINETHQQKMIELITERAMLASYKAQSQTLEGQLMAARQEMVKLNDSEISMDKLNREMNVYKLNYSKYVDHLEEARIDQALYTQNISNINVVQPATYPLESIRPRKMLNITLGLLLGLFSAMLYAFMIEYLDTSIKTPEEIQEKLKQQTLVIIPEYTK